MDLVALKSEITTDPIGRGYSLQSDEAVADLLNAPTRMPNRDSITSGELAGAITAADWGTLTAEQKARLQFLVTPPSLQITAHLRQELRDIFPQGKDSRANLRAVLMKTGSRAEELGLGSVTPSDVADARRLP